MAPKIRRKSLVGQQMYGLVQGGKYNYFSPAVPLDPAPIISNIQETLLGTDTITITWDTNIASNSVVRYGLTVAYGSEQSSPTLVTSHSVTINGLDDLTLYHYQVRSTGNNTETASSADGTFTTNDGTGPVISNIQVTLITEDSARITWTTDEASDSLVDYGLTTGYGSQQSNASLVTSHTIDLTGLTDDTLYHFRITSEDASGNSTASTDQSFTTEEAALTSQALVSANTSSYAHRTVATGNLPSAPPYTICFWLRRESNVAGQGGFSFHNHQGSDDGYLIFYNFNNDNTSFAWEQGGGAYPQLGIFTLPLNVWTFVAISWTGTGSNQTTVHRRIETDIALTSATGTFPTAPNGDGITRETVLTHSFNLVNTFQGRIAGLKIWTRALSGVEVLAESHQATPVSSVNLFQAFPMDDALTANNLLDESGSARNLTQVGTITTTDGPDYT